MSEMQTYTGGCQCGAVRYEVETDLSSMGECNCSRCQPLGWVLQSAPASAFKLQKGEDSLALYKFNTKTIEHLFCKVCGVESFARGTGQDGAAMVMVNVNCLDGVPKVDRSTIQQWDGRSW